MQLFPVIYVLALHWFDLFVQHRQSYWKIKLALIIHCFRCQIWIPCPQKCMFGCLFHDSSCIRTRVIKKRRFSPAAILKFNMAVKIYCFYCQIWIPCPQKCMFSCLFHESSWIRTRVIEKRRFSPAAILKFKMAASRPYFRVATGQNVIKVTNRVDLNRLPNSTKKV